MLGKKFQYEEEKRGNRPGFQIIGLQTSDFIVKFYLTPPSLASRECEQTFSLW